MRFLKSTAVFLGTVLASIGIFSSHTPAAFASALFTETFSAVAPTSTLGTIRQVRVDPADDTVYVLGSGTSALGSFSADGSSFNSISYNVSLPSHSGSDLNVSDGRAFIVTNGVSNTINRYDISGSVASFVASSSLTTGVSAVTLGGSTIYASKGSTLYSFGADLSSLATNTTASSSINRLAYGGGRLFYLSTTGRLTDIVPGVSETTIMTGGPTSATAKGLVASNDGQALYYATTTGFRKLSADGATLWIQSVSSLAGIDMNTSTGRITAINSSGVVTTYSPINPVSSFSGSASGTSALLSWETGISDADFSGVTIRRSASSYPSTATDGIAVTSSHVGTTFTDADLDEGTYYYSIFNETVDGYYGAAATSTVTIDLPPMAPIVSAEVTDSNTISLSWSVPLDTANFVLRRDTTSFPITHTDGLAVTTTLSTVTSMVDGSMPDSIYYYSLFAVDAGGNYSTAGTASVLVDTTPPTSPTLSVTASGSTVSLSWDTPLTTDSFSLRRSITGFPTSTSDGTSVTSTSDTNFTDTSLEDGIHYYSLFAFDSHGNRSNAGTASVSIDTTTPNTPSDFSALTSGSSVYLTWSNPVDADFASSTIRRSTTSFPSSITDGLPVTSTTATSYTDISLSDGTYYYSIFSADTTGNISERSTSTAIISTYTPPASPIPSSGGGGTSFIASVWANIASPSFSAPKGAPPVPYPAILNNEQDLQIRSSASTQDSSPVLSKKNPSIPVFVRFLRQGDRGADVKALQLFLNVHGFIIAKNGSGSPGYETTVFGPATTKAMKKFQETYKDMVLKPYRLEKGTGILGIKTLALINQMR